MSGGMKIKQYTVTWRIPVGIIEWVAHCIWKDVITEKQTGQHVAYCRKLRGKGKMSLHVTERKGSRLRIWQSQQRRKPRKTDARSKYQFCKDWITYLFSSHTLTAYNNWQEYNSVVCLGKSFCVVRLKLFREVKNGCEINSLFFVHTDTITIQMSALQQITEQLSGI